MTIYAVAKYDGELQHHGVKGQKWGVRRYQNPDGSLTSAGRLHYGYGDGSTTRQTNAEGKRFNTMAVTIRSKNYASNAWDPINKAVGQDKTKSRKEKKALKQIIKDSKDATTRYNVQAERLAFFKDPYKAKKDLDAEMNISKKSLRIRLGIGRTMDAVSFLAIAGAAMTNPVTALPTLAATTAAAGATELYRQKLVSDLLKEHEANEKAWDRAYTLYAIDQAKKQQALQQEED